MNSHHRLVSGECFSDADPPRPGGGESSGSDRVPRVLPHAQ